MPFTPDQVLFLDEDLIYGADELGLPYRDIMGEGVVSATDFAVSERGAGANLSVDVSSGACWIKGDDSATLQPTYRYREAAITNLAVATADPTNPRIDIVIAEIRDSTFAGVNKDGRLRVITGTPAGSPTPPATPNNAIKLAEVSIPANDTTITNNQITDTRPRATVGGGAAANPFGGMTQLGDIDLTSAQTFSSIPASFRSLKLVIKVRVNVAAVLSTTAVRFNADSGANYDYLSVVGNNGAWTFTASTAQTSLFTGGAPGTSATANRYGYGEFIIPGYRETDNHKGLQGFFSVMGTSAAANMAVYNIGGVWLNTAAITSLTLVGGAAYLSGSRAQLYGVL